MSQPELQRLNPGHYKILDLALAGSGPKEIASVVGMTPQGVTLVMKSPLFQDQLARRREGIEKKMDDQLASIPAQAKKLLEDSALQAANTMVALTTSLDPKVQLGASKDILDRVFGEGSRDQRPVVVLEADAIQLLVLARKESSDHRTRCAPATLVDTTGTEVVE